MVFGEKRILLEEHRRTIDGSVCGNHPFLFLFLVVVVVAVVVLARSILWAQN
jgi:hypothetical protein